MQQHRSLYTIPSNKNMKSDYQHHLRRLSEIRHASKPKYEQVNNLAQLKTLQKWKQTAKNYETLQHDNEVKKQNKDLLQRLWKISKEKPNRTLEKKYDTSQLRIKHRQINNKKFIEKVDEQNLILAKNLVQQSKSVKSKSQIKQEMKEYLFRRMKLRKVMSPEEIETFKKRSRSHNLKLMRLSSPFIKSKVE